MARRYRACDVGGDGESSSLRTKADRKDELILPSRVGAVGEQCRCEESEALNSIARREGHLRDRHTRAGFCAAKRLTADWHLRLLKSMQNSIFFQIFKGLSVLSFEGAPWRRRFFGEGCYPSVGSTSLTAER